MRISNRETSTKARWSLRLALFAAQLMILTVLLHRFGSLSTPAATNLIVVALITTAGAVLLALLAFIKIWNLGIKGTGIALSGLIVSLMIFAVPLYHLPSLIRLPAINDVTTDLLSPPQFRKITALRDISANSTTYPGTLFISRQARAYPDIGTLMLERSSLDSYDLIHNVIADLGWKIVSEQNPDKKNPTGYIEAIDQSRLLGFRDDVVVRVAGNSNSSRIDMRSASRYGRHDLGSNANRIRNVFTVIKTRIAKAEAKRIDMIERDRIARQLVALRKKKAIEKKKRLRKKALESAPVMLPKARFDRFGLEPDAQGMGAGMEAGMAADKRVRPAGVARRKQGGSRASGFDILNTVQKPRRKARKRRTQKIHRSRRKRRQKKWVPFDLP